MPGLNDFDDFITPLIESQFPNIYKQDGPEFVAFIKAYYEYLEQTDKDLFVLRKLFEYNDVDQSVTSFLEHFRKTYLVNFPWQISQGVPFTVKHIMDLYRSKGTPRGVELYLKLAYGIDSSLYIPGENIITASDADWFDPKYIEVVVDYDKDSTFSDFAGMDITGSISKATATVNSCLKTTANGKITYVMFIYKITGTFKRGELISYAGGTYKPKITGSLSDITLTANGTGLSVGNELEVTSSRYGTQGLVRVTEITDGTGRASYAINDTGFGYSTNSALSNVLVSTATLAVNNYTNGDATIRAEYGGNNFFLYETITQPVEVVEYITSTAMASNVNTTTYVVGTNSSITSLNGSNHLANGQVTVASNTGANGTLTLMVNEGTFGNQVHYYHQSNTIGFEVGEKVSVNSTVYGYLNAANSTVLTINAATTGFSNLATQQLTGERSGAVSNGISAADKLVQTGVKKLFLAATLAINANTSAVSNAYRTGTIIGANSTAIGLVANSTDNFYTSSQNFIKGNDSNTYANVTAIRLGSGASLTIGNLGPDTETKNVYTDFISSSNNSANTDIRDIIINGANSGVGIVNSVTITTAGSGYANGDALVFGANSTVFGGIASGKNPSLNAIATVGTDGSGAITSVTLTGHGNGYYHAPRVTITSSGGSSGVLTPVMNFGYGLAKHGNTINTTKSGGYSNVINDVLNFSESTLGQINTFSSTSGGNTYTAAPFVLVQNKLVDKFNQRNANITYDTFISATQSAFAVDDVIVQTQPQSFLQLTHNGANDAAFNVGEGVVQVVNSTVNNYATIHIANTTVITVRDGKRRQVLSGGAINIAATDASITWSTGNTFVGLGSGSTANITGQSTETVNRFVKGRVMASNSDAKTVEVRMHDSRFDFVLNTNIHLENYSSQANLVSYYYHTANTSTRTTGLRGDERAGVSANINVAATTSSGLISSLEVVRSGYGYEDGETVTMSGGDLENISGTAVVNNHGISTGYHRSNRGFLNEDKYIHDNDYYQEYSYEVRSELPLAKYKQPLIDIVHLAGTKLFGRLQTSLTVNMALSVANSSVSQA